MRFATLPKPNSPWGNNRGTEAAVEQLHAETGQVAGGELVPGDAAGLAPGLSPMTYIPSSLEIGDQLEVSKTSEAR